VRRVRQRTARARPHHPGVRPPRAVVDPEGEPLMCLQCVRAERRQAEGRPARWQRPPARLLMLPDVADPAAGPTAAELARAVDITRYIVPGSMRFTPTA